MIVVFSFSMRTRLALAQHIESDVFELDAEILADHLTAGQDRHVFEHRLAPVAKAGRLDRRDLKPAAQFVDDEGRQCLALDILGDDQQRLAATGRPLRAMAARICRLDSFFSFNRMYGSSSSATIFSALVTK